jgi:hypothetical protein
MNTIKTYEGFFSKLFGSKEEKSVKSDSNVKKSDKKSFLKDFHLFSKKDDEFAKKVYDKLFEILQNKDNSQIIDKVRKYADYKRTIKFKAKSGEQYVVAIQKTSSKRRFTTKSFLVPENTFVLVINNRHFIDRVSGKSTVSQKLLLKIWNLLDSEHDKAWFDREKLNRDFE